MLPSPKGPKYLYGTKYGFCSRNFPYGLGKYSPYGYLGPFGKLNFAHEMCEFLIWNATLVTLPRFSISCAPFSKECSSLEMLTVLGHVLAGAHFVKTIVCDNASNHSLVKAVLVGHNTGLSPEQVQALKDLRIHRGVITQGVAEVPLNAIVFSEKAMRHSYSSVRLCRCSLRRQELFTEFPWSTVSLIQITLNPNPKSLHAIPCELGGGQASGNLANIWWKLLPSNMAS